MTIQNRLKTLQDLQYREFSLKLLPKDTNLIGVRLPLLRKLSKEVSLLDLTDDTFEEIMLQGMVIGHIRNFLEFKKACLLFLPKIHNWSICDSFVSGLKITNQYPEEMLAFLETLVDSPLEYTRRFVLVMLLRYYMNSEYLEVVLNILKRISKEEYYVQMASAWLIAEIYLYHQDVALAILSSKEYNLNKFIFDKAISKIKDSYRVSSDAKRMLKQFQQDVSKNFDMKC